MLSLGKYRPYNLNHPMTLPIRHDGMEGYGSDSPLTEMGLVRAYLTGEQLKDAVRTKPFVIASPAFRCIQTARQIIRGLFINVSHCVS